MSRRGNVYSHLPNPLFTPPCQPSISSLCVASLATGVSVRGLSWSKEERCHILCLLYANASHIYRRSTRTCRSLTGSLRRIPIRRECWQPALGECRRSRAMKEGAEVVDIALLSSSGMLVSHAPPKYQNINYALSVAIVASRQGSGWAGRLRRAKPSLG